MAEPTQKRYDELKVEFGEELGSALGAGQLDDLIFGFQRNGRLTEEEGDALFSTYSARADTNLWNYVTVGPYAGGGPPRRGEPAGPSLDFETINTFVSRADLGDKLAQAGLTDEFQKELYRIILSRETPAGWAVRAAGGRATRAQEKLAQQQEQARREYEHFKVSAAGFTAGGRVGELSEIYNNPYTTQADINRLRDMPITDTTTVGRVLGDIQSRDPNFQKQPTFKGRQALQAEDQANRALIAGLGRAGQPTQEQRKPLPSAQPVVGKFLGETGLAGGSRIRDYIESQLGGIVSGAQRERQNWWERMNPVAEPTYQDEIDRITAERDRWSQIAGSAGTSTVAGGTYYGPGGLAAIARGAAARSQASLAEKQADREATRSSQSYLQNIIDPITGEDRTAIRTRDVFEGDEQEPVTKTPDPLWGILNQKDFLSGYRRLTASQRGQNVARFRPAARFS